MKAALLLAALGLTLAACSGQPVVRTVEVQVPVAVPCVPDTMPPRPRYPDTDATLREAPDYVERYRLLILGREARAARLGALEGVVDACREVAE